MGQKVRYISISKRLASRKHGFVEGWVISKIVSMSAVSVLLLAWSGTALAQGRNALEQLLGLNAAQQQMARSTDGVCAALNAPGQTLTTSQQNLRRNCSSLVNDAAGFTVYPPRQPGVAGEPTELNFGLTSPELANALQRIAGEEAQAPRLLTTRGQDGQIRSLRQRMAALRTSASRGGIVQFDVNGLTQPRQYASLDSDQTAQTGTRIEEPVYFGPWGFFLLGNISFGDQNSTSEIDGFSFSNYTITTGVDYRILENLVVGVALGFNHLSTNFDTTINSQPNQYLNNDSYYLSAYSTYYLPKEFYVDGIISFAHNDFNSRRIIDIRSSFVSSGRASIINRPASADYGGTQFGFSLGGGRDWSFDALTINTSARLGYSRSDIDSYTENPAAGWELAFDSQTIESLTTHLALQASYAISTNFGVLLPYVKASWVHEFLNDGDGIGFRYANDPTNLSKFTIIPVGPDRNYFPLGAGVSVTFPNGWAAFADYESTVGIKDFTSHLFTVGLRKEF